MLVSEIRKPVWNSLGKGSAQIYPLCLLDAPQVWKNRCGPPLEQKCSLPQLSLYLGTFCSHLPSRHSTNPQHPRLLEMTCSPVVSALRGGQRHAVFSAALPAPNSRGFPPALDGSPPSFSHFASRVSGLSRSLQCILLSNTCSFHLNILVELILNALAHFPVCLYVPQTKSPCHSPGTQMSLLHPSCT